MLQVGEVTALEGGLQEPQRMGDSRLQDADGRAADGVVAVLERRPSPRRIAGHDDGGGDDRDGGARRRDGGARPPSPVPYGEPEPEHGDAEPHLLLRQAGQPGSRREGDQALLVEEPDGGEQERGREGDGVEVVENEPLGRRVEKVGEREAEACPFGAEMLVCEEIHGHRAERHRDRLGDEQQGRVGPEPPQRREGRDDRVEMGAEP